MFNRGSQIVYMPTHANGNIHHPDCEPGFVTNRTVFDGEVVFCRFWASLAPPRLRTKANSELARIRDLVIRDSVPQACVEDALWEWCSKAG
jgi:hypothetical protein